MPKGAIAIIPARLGSTRFPRKALAAETGKPLVVHVCERAAAASRIERVVVATDAEEIASAVRDHGFEAIMTGEHDNGTSRLAEAARKLNLAASQIVVNVQGDEPEIEPEVIDAAFVALDTDVNHAWDRDPHAPMGNERFPQVGTVASPFGAGEDPADPNLVKAVVGQLDGDFGVGPGLYFTRAAVPFERDASVGIKPLKHVGIYAYEVGDLFGYLNLPPTPLEQTEKLEQLRWLEYGLTIAVAVRTTAHVGIDTPEQYAAFVERFRSA